MGMSVAETVIKFITVVDILNVGGMEIKMHGRDLSLRYLQNPALTVKIQSGFKKIYKQRKTKAVA